MALRVVVQARVLMLILSLVLVLGESNVVRKVLVSFYGPGMVVEVR